jgi:hypothetical protein
VAGYLRDGDAWQHLVRRIDHKDGTVSIYAAWALVQINPAQAAPLLVYNAIAREDWPMSKLVLIMQDGAAAVMAPFVEALDTLQGPSLKRALKIAEGLRVFLNPALHARLLDGDDIETVIAALRVPVAPAELPRVRRLAAQRTGAYVCMRPAPWAALASRPTSISSNSCCPTANGGCATAPPRHLLRSPSSR